LTYNAVLIQDYLAETTHPTISAPNSVH
jgi:hypothetical protein